MTDTLTITRPDDWHLHLRDGAALQHTVADASRYFGRAIVMPNLTPPVTNLAEAMAYRERILAQRPTDRQWQPLMVLYLTDNTSAETIRAAYKEGQVTAAKLYPAGATTNSDSGVTALENIYPALEAMAEVGMPLLVHGEVTHDSIDIFDREAAFIDQQLSPLRERYPELRIVFEHITTEDAAQFVRSADSNVGATITPQHLMYNRNHLLVGGIKPHFYCLPVLKRNRHQQALRDVVASGDNRFFLGTDSAPHAQNAKENSCGCAGCYSAHAALELYAEVFEELGVLDKLEAFASFNGPDFYRLPRHTDQITLRRQPWTIPETQQLGEQVLVPLRAGETLQWQVIDEERS
ncbi:dihydroorotase [Aestuariirhabdus sp. Z084]|uniref:dihydroorotase n=1 Tax=Aestuariirhabdus haliotis TaxID=2918751 RepID=UPI00201B44F9|nr:dihydroorotase [Aestuariirhabdus haliotis]MCL6416286.1 dihydroorotase [Aestuariirhabdus haliotis]MCL6420159.1 dihydroorotase [Aestuariirhabdus haliotis]